MPMPHDTLLRVVHDTTTRVITDTVGIVAALQDPRRSHDLFDWLQLAGTYVVTPVVALVAALYGARIGGGLAREAALEIHQKEVEANRQVRESERQAEREARRNRMKRRVTYTLARLRELSDSVMRQLPDEPIKLSTLQAVLRVCDRYDETLDDATHLAHPEFGDELRTWLEHVVTTAQLALDDEQALLEHQQKQRAGIPTSVEITRIHGNRKKSWESIRDWSLAAKSHLERLRDE